MPCSLQISAGFFWNAGSALFTASQLASVHATLAAQLYSNPHSDHAASRAAGSALAELRAATLALCNASPADYDVIFTSGATAALQLVASAFPWRPGSVFGYTLQNHTSVVGMRGPAAAAGARVCVVTATQQGTAPGAVERFAFARVCFVARCNTNKYIMSGDRIAGEWQLKCCGAFGPSEGALEDGAPPQSPPQSAAQPPAAAAAAAAGPLHLFAMPVECNLTGRRLPASLARHVQQFGLPCGSNDGDAGCVPCGACGYVGGGGGGGSRADTGTSSGAAPSADAAGRWLVLLDAAKACGSAPPDLAKYDANFTVLSYYKIFGYPTGLGALIVKKDALRLLAGRKRYFGGGTVAACAADEDYAVRCAVRLVGLPRQRLPHRKIQTVGYFRTL